MLGEQLDKEGEGFLGFGGVERGAGIVFVQVVAAVTEEDRSKPQLKSRADGADGPESPGINLPVTVPIPRQRFGIFQELVPGGRRLVWIQAHLLVEVFVVEEGHGHKVARNRVIGPFMLHHCQGLGIPGCEEVVPTFPLNEGGDVHEKASLDEGTERVGMQVDHVRARARLNLRGVLCVLIGVGDVVQLECDVGMLCFECLECFLQ